MGSLGAEHTQITIDLGTEDLMTPLRAILPTASALLAPLLILAAGCSTERALDGRIDRAIERDAERLEVEFHGWWDEAAGPADGDTIDPPLRIRQETFGLAALHPLEPATAPRPRQARGSGWEAVDVGPIAHRLAVLWVPTGEPGAEGSARCADAKSYLAVEPYRRWTELPLNPHCDDAYGRDEVRFTLHKLHEITWPLLEVATGGTDCIPTALYRYDERTQRFARVKEACIRPPRAD